MKAPEGTTTKFGVVLRRLCLGRAVFLCPCAGCHIVEEELTQLLFHLHSKHTAETATSSKVLTAAPHELPSKSGSLHTGVAVIVCSHKEKDWPGFRVSCPAPACPFKAVSIERGSGNLAVEEQRYTCPICTFSSPNLEKLKDHLINHGSVPESSTPGIELDPRRLYSTVWSPDGKSLRRCAVCPQTENSKEDIEAHVKRHGAVAEFSCSECNFRDDVEFLVSSIHKSVHSKERAPEPIRASSEGGVLWEAISEKTFVAACLTSEESPRITPSPMLRVCDTMEDTETEDQSSAAIDFEVDGFSSKLSLVPSSAQQNAPVFSAESGLPSSGDEEQRPALSRKPACQDTQRAYPCMVPGCSFSGKSLRSLSGHNTTHRPKTQSRRRKRLIFSNRKRRIRCVARPNTSKVTEAINSDEDTEVNEVSTEALVTANPREKPKLGLRIDCHSDNAGQTDEDPFIMQYRCKITGCNFVTNNRFSIGGHTNSHRPRVSAAKRRLTASASPFVQKSKLNAVAPNDHIIDNEPLKPVESHEKPKDAQKQASKATSCLDQLLRKAVHSSGRSHDDSARSSDPSPRRCSSEARKTKEKEVSKAQKSSISKTSPSAIPGTLLQTSSSFGTKRPRASVVSLLSESKVVQIISRAQSEVSDVTERQLAREDVRVFVLKRTALRKSPAPRDPFAFSSTRNSPEEEDEEETSQGPTDELRKRSVDSRFTTEKTSPVRAGSLSKPGRTPGASAFVEVLPSSKVPIVRRQRARTEFRKRSMPHETITYACRHPGCTFQAISGRSLGGHMKNHRPKTSYAVRPSSPDKRPPVVKTVRKRPQTVFATRPQQRRKRSLSKRAGTEENDAAELENSKVVPFVVEPEENLAGMEERMSQMRVVDQLRFHRVGEGTMVGCPYCPYEGQDVTGMMSDHMAFHGADYMFRCEACNYATTTLDTLQFHQFLHDDVGEPLTEGLRGFIDDAENGLQGVSIPAEVLLEAPKKWAPLKINSVLYLETAENGKLFGCPSCPMRSPYQSITMEHYVRHFIQIGDFACALCNLRLETRPALNQHTDAHLKPAAYGIRNDSQKLLVARAEMNRVFFKVGVALERFKIPALDLMEPQQEQRDPSLLSEPLVEHLVRDEREKQEPETTPDDRVVYKVRVKSLPELATTADGEVMYQCSVCNCLKSTLPGAKRKHLACHGSKRAFTCRFCDFSSTLNGHIIRHERDHEVLSQLSIVRLHACSGTERPRQKRKQTDEIRAILPVVKKPKVTVLRLLDSVPGEPVASTSTAATISVSCRRQRSKPKTPGRKRKSSSGYVLKPSSGNKYVHEWQVPDEKTGVLTTFRYMCLGCRFESKSREDMYIEHVPKHINRGKFQCSLSVNRTPCTFESDSEEMLAYHMRNHHGPTGR